MFQIIAPPDDAQRALQQAEGSFYWSRCVSNWLRKQGLIGYFGADREPLSLVLRMAEASDIAGRPALLEGPLAPVTAQALGLAVQDHEVEALALNLTAPLPPRCPPRHLFQDNSKQETFGCARLQYPRFTQRRIDHETGKWADPEPYEPEDKRHRRDTVRFQTLDLQRSNGMFRPLLMAHAAEPREGEPPAYGVVAATDGRHLVLGVPLFDLFGAVSQMPPMPVSYMATTHDLDIDWLQDWLAATIVELAAASGGTVVRSARWPNGYHWAHSLRVDYDRLLSDAELDAYLDVAARHGVRMSWQFLANRTIPRHAERILRAGHEIALHTVGGNLEAFRAEIDQLRQETGVSAKGSTAHGGLGAMGYSGDLRFGWSQTLGLDYCEMITYSTLTGYCLNRVTGDLPEPSPLFCPAPHRGIDTGTLPHQHMLEQYRDYEVDLVRAHGGHFSLMHHPDIHYREVEQLFESIDWSGCWHTTLEGAVRWARDLHYAATVTLDGEGEMVLTIPKALSEDAVIERLGSEGMTATVLPAGATRVVLQ